MKVTVYQSNSDFHVSSKNFRAVMTAPYAPNYCSLAFPRAHALARCRARDWFLKEAAKRGFIVEWDEEND